MMKTMGDHSATQIRLQQAVEGFSTFVISYYAMGLLEIMLEAGIAAKLLEVNPKIVLGLPHLLSSFRSGRSPAGHVSESPEPEVRRFLLANVFSRLNVQLKCLFWVRD